MIQHVHVTSPNPTHTTCPVTIHVTMAYSTTHSPQMQETPTLLPPRQVAKLSRYGCDPSWFCSPHDACFVHESCFCKGSGKWPLVKPVHSF